MSNVYDVIDELRKSKHWSRRTLANLASIAPTTLASMMNRKSDLISIDMLKKIAAVFDSEWYELLSADPQTELRDTPTSSRIRTEVPAQDKALIISNVLSKPIEPIMAIAATGRGAAITEPMVPQLPVAKYGDDMSLFRRSIVFILNQLNTQGLREAMHQLLIIANDPNNTLKEENLCHEDEPPTAQDYSPESALTDAGNAGSQSE